MIRKMELDDIEVVGQIWLNHLDRYLASHRRLVSAIDHAVGTFSRKPAQLVAVQVSSVSSFHNSSAAAC